MPKIKRPGEPPGLTNGISTLGGSIEDIRFRKLIDKSYDGITLLNRDLEIVYRSKSAELINGWNIADRSKHAMSLLIHPDDRHKVKQLTDEVLISPGLSKICSFRSRHFDGHYIWLECTFTNFFNDPEIDAIVCNFRDISEKKQADELLQQTIKELFAYKYALDESAIVAVTDQKGIIKHVNDKFCKISKYSEEELIGKDHRIINSSYHDKAFIRSLWSTIAGGKIWKGELKNKAKDGSFYWVDTTIVPFLNENEKPYQYVAIRSDITERKNNQEKVIESERFIKTITDNLPAMIAYWDAGLRCLFANKPYLEWFEKQEHEMIGIYKRDLLDEEEFKLHENHIQNVLEGSAQRFERTFYKSNGQRIFTDTQYLPDDEGGIIKGFYSLIYDVTAVKLAEQEINKKTEQIEGILESITDGFIALDENMCYTYANKKIGELLGCTPESLIGKNIWELFPDAIGSATYEAIQTSFSEKKYICNEDHYAPLNLWQENRVYPSGSGISMFIRDISDKKNAEQQEALLSEISQIFNGQAALDETINKVLKLLVSYGNFSGAEFWLISDDKKKINVAARFSKKEKFQDFINQNEIKSYEKGEGLVGIAWETNTMQYWQHSDINVPFKRLGSAIKAGLKKAYALPLVYNEEIIGVLALGADDDDSPNLWFTTSFEGFGSRFGAEIKRKQIEQQLNQIFNFAPDIICIAGSDRHFKKVNPAMCTLLEYTEAEILNKPIDEFVHPDDFNKSADAFENQADGQATLYFENRFITKSGKVKWLAWTSTRGSDEGLFFNVARDITEKKGLEELLNKATTLARIGGWEVDLKKGIVHWSDMTREIHEAEHGFEPTIEEAANFYREGTNRKTIVQIINNAVEMGVSSDIELQIVTAKGNTKWVRVIVEAEFADNTCLRLYGSFQDIDALKKAEVAGIKALEERNTILESIDDAFFALDKNWVVTYWNNMAEKVLLKSKNEVIEHNLWNVFSDSIGSESYKKYHEALETNKAVHFEDHYSVLNKWYEISAYPSDSGLSVYFKDITERKISETRLIELNENLEKHARELAISNAELEQFAYVASHDLQEPLRMVTSFMSQLEKKYGDIVDDKGKQYIHFAVDGAKRMRQIILDLLEFSRVGRTEDDLEEVDLNNVVHEVIALYRKQIEEKQAKIVFNNLPTIQTYKTPIRQVLQNLISNSLKYQKPANIPIISILSKETKTHWQISIKDNGIGIEPEFFDKIFIIFQRLHNKEEYSGTGMGLAITKKIIENLGGRIWVKSNYENGSTFYFTVLKNSKS